MRTIIAYITSLFWIVLALEGYIHGLAALVLIGVTLWFSSGVETIDFEAPANNS